MTWTPARAYRVGMPKRLSKDENETAFAIVALATDQGQESTQDAVRAAARALGALGGKKGGRVRAARMSPEQRSEAASQAAKARWSKRR